MSTRPCPHCGSPRSVRVANIHKARDWISRVATFIVTVVIVGVLGALAFAGVWAFWMVRR